MSLFFSFFRDRKKETCPNCGRTVRHSQRMLFEGKQCCEYCYPVLVRKREEAESRNEGGKSVLRTAPVITERRNGMVHQYSIYSVTCGVCGKKISCRSDDIPRKYEDYEGKSYCRSCWEKKEKEITSPCAGCGKPVSRYERRVFGREGYCPECWDRRMALKRERFGRYGSMLLAFLAERGITAAGSDQTGLLPSGIPAGYEGSEERNGGMIRLRRDEYAVCAFRLGGGWFAVPSSGSSLRYIAPSPDGRLMGFLAGIKETCLAAAVWEKNAAVLTEDGVIHSQDTAVNGLKVFDKGELIRRTAAGILGEEKILKAREAYMTDGIRSIDDRLFYDGGRKVFFRILTDGNYYHGYDVSYPVVSREEILPALIRGEWLPDTEEACEKGTVPMSVIVEGLEDSGDRGYIPPDGFGYGTYFA